MVKSACGIEAVYMCFNGTGIWGGETISLDCTPTHDNSHCDHSMNIINVIRTDNIIFQRINASHHKKEHNILYNYALLHPS